MVKNNNQNGPPAFPTSLKSDLLSKSIPGKEDGVSGRLKPGPQAHIRWWACSSDNGWATRSSPTHMHAHTHTPLDAQGRSAEKPQLQILTRKGKAQCPLCVVWGSAFSRMGSFSRVPPLSSPPLEFLGHSLPGLELRLAPEQVGKLMADFPRPQPGVRHPSLKEPEKTPLFYPTQSSTT